MTEDQKIEISFEVELDQFGDDLEELQPLLGSTFTLPPSNGNRYKITATARYSNGNPAPGVLIDCWSEPKTLTGSEWRDQNKLAARFGRAGSGKIRKRISGGIVRLSAKVSPPRATSDRNGKATFTIESFHICGNDSSPASDNIIIESLSGREVFTVRSALEGLQEIQDNKKNGLMTSGLVGKHLQPSLINVIKAMGKAWLKVRGKPQGMPNFITVTGASMRWGGLNPPHFTHRFGGTADFRPIGTKDGRVSVGDAHYHKQGTAILIDFMKRTGATEIIFADDLPGVTKIKSSHKDHIHASWLKKPDEPWLLPPDFSESSLINSEFSISNT